MKIVELESMTVALDRDFSNYRGSRKGGGKRAMQQLRGHPAGVIGLGSLFRLYPDRITNYSI